MTAPEDDVVLLEVERGVATVTLNRPDSLNAWNRALQGRLFAILDELADDDSVRAVVLTGAGRAFCSGADMEMLSEGDGGTAEGSRPLLAPMWFPKPVVAAVNGACAGIGLQLALMCDVRFAAKQAKLTTAFSRIGLIAEHGLSWLLPRVTSLATASELLLSGRVFNGEEAERRGVVHFAVEREDVLEAAQSYARDLAENVSLTAMAVIKWQVYNHHDRPLLESLDHSDELMRQAAVRPDFVEGVASFVERRQPEFASLDRTAIPPMTFTAKE